MIARVAISLGGGSCTTLAYSSSNSSGVRDSRTFRWDATACSIVSSKAVVMLTLLCVIAGLMTAETANPVPEKRHALTCTESNRLFCLPCAIKNLDMDARQNFWVELHHPGELIERQPMTIPLMPGCQSRAFLLRCKCGIQFLHEVEKSYRGLSLDKLGRPFPRPSLAFWGRHVAPFRGPFRQSFRGSNRFFGRCLGGSHLAQSALRPPRSAN
jgi:hypothetical protein